jgi:predicted nuclease of predicted toxin-antitoxin system
MSHFLLDLGISPKVITLLTSLGHQGTHGVSVGFHRTPDHEILDYAIRHNMLIITSDLGFAELAISEPRMIPGIIILRLRNPNAEQMVGYLKKLLTGPLASGIDQAITVVEPHQIRRTRLPLT